MNRERWFKLEVAVVLALVVLGLAQTAVFAWRTVAAWF